ncbi:hypothetical protein JXA80_04070 [bacterium]|nr:hypothetical protein [candidate division CSSED10-310 bacterium]
MMKRSSRWNTACVMVVVLMCIVAWIQVPVLAAEPSAATRYSGIPDYFRDPSPENFAAMNDYFRTMRKNRAGNTKSVNGMIDSGMEILRDSDNDFGGALKNALRNIDDTAPQNPGLYRLGKGAEIFDFLSRTVKVTDEYNKGKGGNSYDAAVLAGRELTKMLAGNKAGALAVTAILGSGGGAIPAFVIGYAASKGSEAFIQFVFDGYDAIKEQNRNLPPSERERQMAEDTRKARETYDIPDDADVSTYTDERGGAMRETTWTDPESGETYRHATWYNALGHETGSDFGRAEYMDARREAMGATYQRTGRTTAAQAEAAGEEEGGEGEDRGGDEEEEGEIESSRRGSDIDISDYVTPQPAVATGSNSFEISHNGQIATVTTTIHLAFVNVGAQVPGNERAVLTIREKLSATGKETVTTWTGTFSGGPNGRFTLHHAGETVSFRLRNGEGTDDADGISLKVTSPSVFSGWPTELQ